MINSSCKWIYNNKNIDKKIDNNLNENITLDINPLIKKILINRGYDNDEKINKFLYDDYTNFYDPFLIKDMNKACNRIINALVNKEKVIIYGDYDVDGISSTTLLFSYLKLIGMDINYFIPNRLNDGYGLNSDAIRKIASENYNLIITVDTGITAISEAKLIKELGMDLVITDHHEVQDDTIPECCAVVDLKQEKDNYEFRELAGVGIAFKVVCALDKLLSEHELLKDDYKKLDINVYDYLEIACLGTISDIVPLISENRIIVKEGLKKLLNPKSTGLRVLLENTLSNLDKITSTDIAFYLVPKLNAAGRIDDASIGVELLLEEDEDKAKDIVKKLLKMNDLRKKTEDDIYAEAVNMIESNEEYKNDKILILKNKKWHHGVIGIVAAKIADVYNKPTLMLNLEDGILSGSGRKIGSVNIFDIFSKGKEYTDKFGGHEGACGITLKDENFYKFKEVVLNYANEIITSDMLLPTLYVDDEINFDDLTIKNIEDLSLLEPFGEANKMPIFKISCIVSNAQLMGKNNNHLKLKLKNNNDSVDCVAFGKANLYEKIVYDKTFDICGSLNINEYMGQKKVQIMLSDIKSNMIDEINYNFDKALFNKAKRDDYKDIINSDKEYINENSHVNNVNNFIDMLDKYIYDYDAISEYKNYELNDDENISNNKPTLFVTNKKNVIINICEKYNNDVKIFYGDVNINDLKNALELQNKKAFILALNIVKIIDLIKNYSIIYSDNACNCDLMDNYNDNNASISKEEVASVYKRLSYLLKINKDEIFLEDLLFNLKNLNIFKILISLEILKELRIINYEISNDDIIKFNINDNVKNSIENSKIFIQLKKE